MSFAEVTLFYSLERRSAADDPGFPKDLSGSRTQRPEWEPALTYSV
jgi:hypothetical protein